MSSTFSNWIAAELAAIQASRESRQTGQRLEALMARVFSAIPGISFEDQDVQSDYRTEEIDLYFWNDRLPGGLHCMDCPLIVECKGWSGPLPGRELRAFATLLRDKGRTSGVLVALQGIAGNPAERSAGFFHIAAAMAGGQTVLVITGADLAALEDPTGIVRLLRRRMLDQVRGQTLALEGQPRGMGSSRPKRPRRIEPD